MSEEYPWDDPLATTPTNQKAPPKKKHVKLVTEEDKEESEDMPASMSEDYLAWKFTLAHQDEWRFVFQTRDWLHFDGKNWTKETQAVIDDMCIKWTRIAQSWPEAQNLTPSEKRKISQKRIAGAIRDIFAVSTFVRSTPEVWDADDWLLGTPDGTVNLRTGKLAPTQKDQYITKRTAVTPKAGPMPLFNDLLKFVTCGDKEMERYLQRWAGYCCTGSNREQAFAFLIGGGLNGKGTLITCFKNALGDYARIMRDDTLMAQMTAQHTQELAVLDGLRLAFVDETDGSKRFNESRIKALTGGSPVVARKMHGTDYEFPMRAKIIIAGNERPHLRGTGKAMARRMHIIPFLNSIDPAHKDEQLGDKLRDEYPAILAWMIEGCLIWQKEGLGTIQKVKDATSDYLESEDILGMWLEERTVQADSRVDSLALYKDYAEWAETEGHQVWSRRAWANEISTRVQKMKSVGRIMYVGIALKHQQQKKESWTD